MNKSDKLKNSMKGGLNGLLSSTAKEEKTDMQNTGYSTQKEKAVHCNFIINKSIHTRMKYLAIEKDMSLKDIVNKAMEEYLDKYETKK